MWLERLSALPTRTLVAAGASLSGVLLLIAFALPLPAAGPVPNDPARFRTASFFLVMLGCYVASVPLAVRAAVESVEAISGLDDASRARFRRELLRLPRAWGVTACLIGAAMHLRILSVVGVQLKGLSLDVLLTRQGFMMVAGWLHIFAFAMAVGLLLRQGVLFRRVGRELPEISLVDHDTVAPFVSASLRLALLNALWFAIIVAFHVDWTGDWSVAPQVVGALPLTFLIGGALFALPLWGVHQRLRAERNAELSRVNTALRGDRAALTGSPLLENVDSLSSVDLLAYRQHVLSFSTWPFDASVLVRLALYMGIPLVGWVGGALVERGLDALLG